VLEAQEIYEAADQFFARIRPLRLASPGRAGMMAGTGLAFAKAQWDLELHDWRYRSLRLAEDSRQALRAAGESKRAELDEAERWVEGVRAWVAARGWSYQELLPERLRPGAGVTRAEPE